MGSTGRCRWLTDLAVTLVVVAAGTWALGLRSAAASSALWWLSVATCSAAAVTAIAGWCLQRRADPVRRIVGRLPVRVTARSLWWELTRGPVDD